MRNKKNDNNENQMQYMPIGMCIGISIGVGLGAATGNIPIFMCCGLSIGMCIGALIDAQNRKVSKEAAKNEENAENEVKKDE